VRRARRGVRLIRRPPGAPEIRRATSEDAPAIAEIFLASFGATYEFPLAHTPNEVRGWVADHLLPTTEMWVAVTDDRIVGFMSLGTNVVEQLYVAREWTGGGIGSRLIELAKERRPAGLDLFTFQVNARARRFHERHGFTAVWFGDGSENEERQPDVRYAWRPGSAAGGKIGPMERPSALELIAVRQAPKVLLHDHLDGGLRPRTVLELASEIGYRELPTTDPDELGKWFTRGADRKSLELYLEGFRHTVAVLQERDAIERVAAECAEDLAADGVVYAEVRMAPELLTDGRLTLDEAVTAMLDGFRRGSDGRPITIGLIVTAMRQAAKSVEIAELAVRHRDAGVVGFDIAGPEAGYPPTRHLDAFQLIARENFHFTIHAGEGFGLPSIWEALQWCGAERLGHGVRIVDDITVRPDGRVALGRLAAYVRDRRVPLEMCPTSNVHTGAAPSIEEHPIDLLRRLRFRVTVNTDNRLMSGITLSSEFATLSRAFGIGLDEMEWLTLNAMKSAFWPFDGRLRIINEQIKPGYASLRARQAAAELSTV
jgi:adenosine deaminase